MIELLKLFLCVDDLAIGHEPPAEVCLPLTAETRLAAHSRWGTVAIPTTSRPCRQGRCVEQSRVVALFYAGSPWSVNSKQGMKARNIRPSCFSWAKNISARLVFGALFCLACKMTSQQRTARKF